MANTILTDEIQSWSRAPLARNFQNSFSGHLLQLQLLEVFTYWHHSKEEAGPMAGQSFSRMAAQINRIFDSVTSKTANRDTISTSLAETRRAPTADSRSKKAKSKEAPVAVNKQILPKDLLVHLEKVNRTEEFMSEKYLNDSEGLRVNDVYDLRQQLMSSRGMFGTISGSRF